MTASDALAVAAAVVVAIFVGAVSFALLSLTRTLRSLRATVDQMRDETLAAVADLRTAAREAADEVDRVERLVTSAERIEGAVDSAGRLAYRTLASPVVKAMAIGTGVSRAAQRMRDSDEPATPQQQVQERERARFRRGKSA
jgi:hypothetical protein